MTKVKFTPDLTVLKKFEAEAAEIASVTAGIALEAFRALLYDSPQRYGTYVASWNISAGGADRAEVMPYREKKDWYRAGSEPAIMNARAKARRFKGNYARGNRPIYALPPIVITNPTSYMDLVEEGSYLRPANQGHEGAFGKFQDALTASMGRTIVAGAGPWKYYRDYNL